jgi:hypothetical protein
MRIKRSPFAQKSEQKRRFDARRKKNKKKNSKIAPKIQIKVTSLHSIMNTFLLICGLVFSAVQLVRKKCNKRKF